MNNATQITHKEGDRRTVVARGPFKSQFVGRNGRVRSVRPTQYGDLVTLEFDSPVYGIAESQFMPAELDPIVANQDDEN